MDGVPEVAVVGAGIVGLCTAYALAERGTTARVYERGAPGHGQSSGQSRIFRHAHDDPRLVELTRQGRAVWDEWADRLGAELISGDGVVALGGPVPRRLRILQDAGGIPVRTLDSAELHARMPLLADYRGPAMLDEDGGAIRTRAAVESLADALGDSVVTDEVISLHPTGRGTVEVLSAVGREEYATAVVCAGLGTARLARTVGLSLPVQPAAHVRLTFQVRGAPRSGSPACRTATVTSGRSASTRSPIRATADTRWASVRRSRCGRTAASRTPQHWRNSATAPARTSPAHCPASTRSPSSTFTAG